MENIVRVKQTLVDWLEGLKIISEFLLSLTIIHQYDTAVNNKTSWGSLLIELDLFSG